MILGEIDCREGVVLATQKDRYESVDEAMKKVIDVYVETLVALTKAPYNFRVLVHPIAPVLDVTRHLCMRFNALLMPRVKSAIGSRPPIHWLNFVDDLLVEEIGSGSGSGASNSGEQLSLRPELRLDGTHLAPAYLSLVESELQRLEL